MRGDEPQAGVRGGVTQITPTKGQQEEFRVSHLNVSVCDCVYVYGLCVKMIYPEKEHIKKCVHVSMHVRRSMSGRVKQEALTWSSTDMSCHRDSPS